MSMTGLHYDQGEKQSDYEGRDTFDIPESLWLALLPPAIAKLGSSEMAKE
jgi:hypothetical protein